MDLIEDIGELFNTDIVLTPKVMLILSLVGFAVTTGISILYRNEIIASYGTNAYFWFVILLCLNFTNIMISSGYYQIKKGSLLGSRGPIGEQGEIGKKGNSRICSFCNQKNEFGISYSTDYFPIGQLRNTSNIYGKISFWHPQGYLEDAPIGDTIFPKDEKKKIKTYLVGYNRRGPVGFTRLTTINDGVGIFSIWRPIPAPGMVALGDVIRKGYDKPKINDFSTMPLNCLIVGKNKDLIHIASFPDFDKISANPSTGITCCSFWQTPLNTFIAKVPKNKYYNGSLYKNIVDASPKYYRSKTQDPIPDKLADLEKFLNKKSSIIPRIKSTAKSFKANFASPIRDARSKATEYTVRILDLEIFLQSIKISEFFSMLKEIIGSFFDLYKEGITISFKPSKQNCNQEVLSRFMDNYFVKKEISRSVINRKYKLLNELLGIFQGYSDEVLELVRNDPWGRVNTQCRKEMILLDQASKLKNISEMQQYIDKLRKNNIWGENSGYQTVSGRQFLSDDPLLKKMRDYRQEIHDELTQPEEIPLLLKSYTYKRLSGTVETKDVHKYHMDKNLTMLDDLFYLFEGGWNTLISATEDRYGEGINLNSPEHRQRRLFVNYIRTFIPPDYKPYLLKSTCLLFGEINPERTRIIGEIRKIYDNVDRQVSNINAFKNCDNYNRVIRHYKKLHYDIQKYFGHIENYEQKLREMDFQGIPTGRLKWFHKSLADYMDMIKNNCKTDERVIIASSIRELVSQMIKKKCYPNIGSWKGKFKHIRNFKSKIQNFDFEDFSIQDLKWIRNTLRKKRTTCDKETIRLTSKYKTDDNF